MDARRLERLVADVALRELGEDENTREKTLREMRDWIKQHPNILHCRTDDSFLLRFLRAKKYDVTRAQQMLLSFLHLKNYLPPSMLFNHDVATPSVQEFMCDGFYFSSPNRDTQGRQVMMMVLSRLDSVKYSYDKPARTILLTNLLTLENEVSQILGYVFIIDMANMSLNHLRTLPPTAEFIKFLKSGENSIPMRNKEIHVLNLPTFVNCLYQLLKAAINKKIRKRITVHKTLETLHQKVDPRVLPKEYGGVIAMDEMIESWRQELLNKRNTIKQLENIKLKSDKSSDPEPSFRHLEVD